MRRLTTVATINTVELVPVFVPGYGNGWGVCPSLHVGRVPHAALCVSSQSRLRFYRSSARMFVNAARVEIDLTEGRLKERLQITGR